MMISHANEVCAHCSRNICIGQPIVECHECDQAIRSKCYNYSEIDSMNDKFYCNDCSYLSIKKYNPFKFDLENDEIDLDDNLQKLSLLLNNCKSYSVKKFNNIYKDKFPMKNSMLFQNIDGNKFNFDTLVIELRRFKLNFSIIALVETNVGPEMSSMYGLDNYKSFYQEKHNNKHKGTGVALYVLKSLNATLLSNISKVSENLESNFVKITNGDIPIIFGALYRPPSGDIDKALTELAEILDELPKKCYIGGDFNIDLHDKKRNKHIQELEDITMSRGFSL